MFSTSGVTASVDPEIGHLRAAALRSGGEQKVATPYLESESEHKNARKLSDVVPEDARHGVMVSRLLGMFGARMGKLGCITVNDKNLFELSQPVTSLDDFVSHDWHTRASAKFLTLCFLYNGKAAVVASSIAAIMFGLLQLDQINALPRPLKYSQVWAGYQISTEVGFAGTFAGALAFMVFFFFWQHVKALFSPNPAKVFFDKLCVHQTDMMQKQTAILSLSGFLNMSDRMVILWSSEYFSRLWCVYELATWLHLGKGMDKVEFLPVELSVISITTIVMYWITVLLSVVLAPFLPTVVVYCVMILVLMIVFAANFRLRRSAADLSQLEKHLTTFAIRESKCFCCSVDHVHPDTGNALPCDRQLIYSKLHEWFPDSSTCKLESHSSDIASAGAFDFLDRFDQAVRSELGEKILSHITYSWIPWQHFALMAMPQLAFMTDRFTVMSHLPTHAMLRYLVTNLVQIGLLPLQAKLSVFTLSLAVRCWGENSHVKDSWYKFQRYLLTATACLVPPLTLWIGMFVCDLVTVPASVLPQIVFQSLILCIELAAYSPRRTACVWNWLKANFTCFKRFCQTDK